MTLKWGVPPNAGKSMPDRRRPAAPSDPLVAELFQLLDATGLSFEAIARRTGYDRQSLYGWRSGTYSPKLRAVVDLAGSVGYELVLRPKQE